MGWKNWSYASKGGIISFCLCLLGCFLIYLLFFLVIIPQQCKMLGIKDCLTKNPIGMPQGGIYFWLILVLVLLAFYLPGYIIGSIIDRAKK